MDEPKPVVSLETTGSVGSRFVSQNDLDEAKKRKEEEWKAAYARLGQEPPPMQEEAEYDPRSLYEKLSAQKETKKEEWDDKMRMSNQWRGLEEDEVAFLRDTASEQREQERELKKRDQEELAAFRARQTKQAPPSLPSTVPLSSTTSPPIEAGPSKPSVSKPVPTNQKKGIKGLVKGLVKKKDAGGKSAAGGSAGGSNGKADVAAKPPTPPAAAKSPGTIPPAPSTSKPPTDPPTRKRSIGLLGGYSDSDSDSDSNGGSGTDGEGDEGPKKKQKVD